MNSISKIREERECFAAQLITLGNKVVAISEDVRNRQVDRLSGVTRERKEDENPLTAPLTAPSEEWPSLLSELRGLFWAIEKNLNLMNGTFDLLEI